MNSLPSSQTSHLQRSPGLRHGIRTHAHHATAWRLEYPASPHGIPDSATSQKHPSHVSGVQPSLMMHDQGPRTLKPPRRRRKKTPRPTTVPSRLVPTHPDPPALTSHDEPGPGGCCTRGFKRTSPALPAASALFASITRSTAYVHTGQGTWCKRNSRLLNPRRRQAAISLRRSLPAREVGNKVSLPLARSDSGRRLGPGPGPGMLCTCVRMYARICTCACCDGGRKPRPGGCFLRRRLICSGV